MLQVSIGDEIIGHGTQLGLLERWTQHPAPGYLFVGPAHLGKRTIAERFVQQLLDQPSVSLNAAHPDLVLLIPDEGKTMISVETVRKARLRLSERPMVASRLVAYIPNAHQLNEEGMNALLKVLEEPPAGAVFVCVTEEASRLPATVLSRLVKIPFSAVPRQELLEGLRARGFSNQEAEQRAKMARGRPGIALAENVEPRAGAERFFSTSNLGERLSMIEALAKNCESSDNTAEAWNAALEEWAEACRQSFLTSPHRAIVLGQGIVTARRWVGGPLSPRLPLEAAAVRAATSHPLHHLFPSGLPTPYPAIFI